MSCVMVKADGRHGTRVPRAAPPRSRERGRTNHPHATALLPAKPNDHRGRVAENVARLHQQRSFTKNKTQRPRRTSVTRTRPPVREAARKRVALIALDVARLQKFAAGTLEPLVRAGVWYSTICVCGIPQMGYVRVLRKARRSPAGNPAGLHRFRTVATAHRRRRTSRLGSCRRRRLEPPHRPPADRHDGDECDELRRDERRLRLRRGQCLQRRQFAERVFTTQRIAPAPVGCRDAAVCAECRAV